MRKSPRIAWWANKDSEVIDESNTDSNDGTPYEKSSDSLLNMETLQDYVDDANRHISQYPKNNTTSSRVTCHRVLPTPPADVCKRVIMIREAAVKKEKDLSRKSKNDRFSNDNKLKKSSEEGSKSNGHNEVSSNKIYDYELSSEKVSEDEDLDSASSGELFKPSATSREMIAYDSYSDGHPSSNLSRNDVLANGDDDSGPSSELFKKSIASPSRRQNEKVESSLIYDLKSDEHIGNHYESCSGQNGNHYESCSGQNDGKNDGIDFPLSSNLYDTNATQLSDPSFENKKIKYRDSFKSDDNDASLINHHKTECDDTNDAISFTNCDEASLSEAEEESSSEPTTECGSGPRCVSIYGGENSNNGEGNSVELKTNKIGTIPMNAGEIQVNVKVLNAPNLSVWFKEKPTSVLLREFRRRGINKVVLKRNGEPRYEEVSVDTSTIENQLLLNSIISLDSKELVSKKVELAKTSESAQSKRLILRSISLRSDKPEIATHIVTDRAKKNEEDCLEMTRKRKETIKTPTTSDESETSHDFNQSSLLEICELPAGGKKDILKFSEESEEDTFVIAKKCKSGTEEMIGSEKYEGENKSKVEDDIIFSDESFTHSKGSVSERLERALAKRIKSRKITSRRVKSYGKGNASSSYLDKKNDRETNKKRKETDENATVNASDDSETPECVSRKKFNGKETPVEKVVSELLDLECLYEVSENEANVVGNNTSRNRTNNDKIVANEIMEVKGKAITNEVRNSRRTNKGKSDAKLEANESSYDDGILGVIDASSGQGNISERAKRKVKDKPVVKKKNRNHVAVISANELSYSLFDEDDENCQSRNQPDPDPFDSSGNSSGWLLDSSRFLSTSYGSMYNRAFIQDNVERMREDDINSCKVFYSVFKNEKNERETPPPSPTDIFGGKEVILPGSAIYDDLESVGSPSNVSHSPAVIKKKRGKATIIKKVGKNSNDDASGARNFKNSERKETGVVKNLKVDDADFKNLKNTQLASKKQSKYSLRNKRVPRSTGNFAGVPANATLNGKNDVKNKLGNGAEGNVSPNKVTLKKCRKCNTFFSIVEYSYHITECDIHSQE